MNNERRKELNKIQDDIRNLKDRLNSIASDERFCFDNLPEGLQTSFRGEKMEENADSLDEACDIFDEIIDLIDETLY